MKNRHIFNRSICFGISRKALVAMAICATFPAVAMAGPAPASMAPITPASATFGTQSVAIKPAIPVSMAPVTAAVNQFSTPGPVVPPEVIVTQAPVNISSFAVPVPNTFW